MDSDQQNFRDLEGKSSVKEACSTVTQMDTERTSSKPETEEAEGDEEGGIDIQDLSLDEENFFSSEEEE